MRTTHNPGFLSDDELIDGFVVREHELASILETLRENTGPANQHLLVVGQRGMGKTTLVRRVAAEIRRSEALAKAWFPVVFGEESYGVTSPGELWLEALLHLADAVDEPRWRTIYEELRGEQDEQRLSTRALARLVDFAEEREVRLILGVENLHMLLGEQMSDEAGWAVRKVLQTQPRIMLLGTAVSHFSALDEPKRPFYNLFREIHVQGVSQVECQAVWNAVSGRNDSVLQARSVQILTGGNPRLIAVLAGFARARSFQALMQDLLGLVDDHTSYFKANVEALPPKERKIFTTLADIWAPATARQVGERARISINESSAMLRRLANRGAVRVAYKVGRVSYYEVAERLYNIYHLMRRRGSPEHTRVKALVEFMAPLYSEPGLDRNELSRGRGFDQLLASSVRESKLRELYEVWSNADLPSWAEAYTAAAALGSGTPMPIPAELKAVAQDLLERARREPPDPLEIGAQ